MIVETNEAFFISKLQRFKQEKQTPIQRFSFSSTSPVQRHREANLGRK